MSGDRSQQYLADGFSEELIDALSNVDSLRVTDRTSSFYFGDHSAPVAEIARRLNVGAVLEGSIRRDGRHLRITVALINAVSGYRFWAHSYDRDFSDILNLQREIAENVTQSLVATLHAGERMQMPVGGTNNSLAFDDFLRGLRFMNGRDEPSYRSSLAAFDEAVRLDPGYARAQVMRAYVLMFLAAFGTATDQDAVRNTLLQALGAANRAVLLAPGWGESYAAKGAVLMTMLDFAGSERELQRARSLAPGDIGVDRPYAYLESYLGHPAAAEAAAARVVARYPTDGNGYWDQARVYYLDRHYQDALAASRHGSALVATGPPGGDEATWALAWLALGRADMAARICAPNKTWEETLCLAIAAHRLGNFAEAQSRLAALRTLLGERGAYNYAQIYAQWGAPENALAWLETAYRLHDTGIVQLKVDPLMDPIRARPEFADIEHRLNFPP
jgi:TolB-like protein/tetratricopeptide (TPR) repeat protein